MKHLIIGGARSGKSGYGEQLALATGKSCCYIATGWAGDGEMAARIELHKQRRDSRWQLVEEPIHLAQTLQAVDGPGNVILVDCLTLWLSNALHQQVWPAQKQALLETLPALCGDIYLISNEVGSGIVPLGELSRTFADESGWLNQALAQLCQQVTLVVAGLPLPLKASATLPEGRQQ